MERESTEVRMTQKQEKMEETPPKKKRRDLRMKSTHEHTEV